jgi:hypothetical protein
MSGSPKPIRNPIRKAIWALALASLALSLTLTLFNNKILYKYSHNESIVPGFLNKKKKKDRVMIEEEWYISYEVIIDTEIEGQPIYQLERLRNLRGKLAYLIQEGLQARNGMVSAKEELFRIEMGIGDVADARMVPRAEYPNIVRLVGKKMDIFTDAELERRLMSMDHLQTLQFVNDAYTTAQNSQSKEVSKELSSFALTISTMGNLQRLILSLLAVFIARFWLGKGVVYSKLFLFACLPLPNLITALVGFSGGFNHLPQYIELAIGLASGVLIIIYNFTRPPKTRMRRKSSGSSSSQRGQSRPRPLPSNPSDEPI